MKKAVPGVAARVINRVKKDIEDDKKLADSKIKAYNRRLISSAPAHRAPEPEKKPEEKTEDTAASDAAVDENKSKAKAAEPEYTKTMTAQKS